MTLNHAHNHSHRLAVYVCGGCLSLNVFSLLNGKVCSYLLIDTFIYIHLYAAAHSFSFIAQEIEKLGGTCELAPLGDQTLPDGKKLPLPPILLGSLGNDPKKKTLLVYGHLDVQPAEKVTS